MYISAYAYATGSELVFAEAAAMAATDGPPTESFLPFLPFLLLVVLSKQERTK